MQTLVTTNEKNDLIPKSFLQSGNNLKINENIDFKHPIVQDIYDIDKMHLGLHSEEEYYSMVNVFLTDPYDYMVYLDDKGIDYEKTSSFEVFCLLFKDYLNVYKNLYEKYPKEEIDPLYKNNIYFKAFRFFLGIDSFYIGKDENGVDVIAYDKQYLFDSTVYDYITEFVRKINGISETEKIYPEEEWAKQILIEDERDRLKRLKKKHERGEDEDKNTDRLGNLISSVTWSCNGGITPFNRNKLHVYDLIDGIHRTDKRLHYNNTMIGLYSGCLDKKKINFNELHWSS